MNTSHKFTVDPTVPHSFILLLLTYMQQKMISSNVFQDINMKNESMSINRNLQFIWLI